jgi:hypothetical protein
METSLNPARADLPRLLPGFLFQPRLAVLPTRISHLDQVANQPLGTGVVQTLGDRADGLVLGQQRIRILWRYFPRSLKFIGSSMDMVASETFHLRERGMVNAICARAMLTNKDFFAIILIRILHV